METGEQREERLKIMWERQRETRAMETDDEREVMLERHRQREIRDVETAEQREERLKVMRERPIERTAMETAEQRDLNFGSNEMTLATFFPSVIFPLKYLTSRFFLLAFIGETSTTIP